MSLLLEPTVGPIIGHTTTTQARIWMRGDVVHTNGVVKRCTGALRHRTDEREDWSPPILMKLEPHFDGTAVFVLESLQPDTRYEYQTGWYVGEAPALGANADTRELELNWPERVDTFFTQPDDDGRRSFALGSCRYLLTVDLGPLSANVFDERGDKIFERIRASHASQRLHGVLFSGDQIYADDMYRFASAATLGEYFEVYRRSFGQRHFRDLVSAVPTYMMLDDHEIEDNWPANAHEPGKIKKFRAAVHAYQVYQASHSPLFAVEDQRISGVPNKLWYEFSNGACDFFVMDTRTERVLDGKPSQMIGSEQMTRLLEWLGENPGANRIRFVVSAVPFLSVLPSESADKWSGFPAQRGTILESIQQRRIRNVVFLSGDVHCSFACSARRNGIEVNQIVSSPLFWAAPSFFTANVDFAEPLRTDGGAWELIKRSEVYRNDNFVRFDADPGAGRIVVTIHDRKGNEVEEVTLKLD